MPTKLPVRVDLDPKNKRQSPEERDLLKALDDLEAEGAEHRKRWADPKDVERDIKLYRGEVGPPGRDPYFECNFIQAFIDRMTAQLTDNRPIIRVEPRKAGLRGVAQVASKVVGAYWDDQKMQRQTYRMAHNAAIQRSAGMYTGRDGQEVIELSQVGFDPMVQEAALITQAEYRWIERVKPVSELMTLFPGRGAEVKPDVTVGRKDGSSRSMILSPLSDLLKGRSEVRDAVGRAKVQEWLVKDRQRSPGGAPMFPNGRMILRTKDLLLWDGPNPFWDGEDPLDWFDWCCDPEHPFGISEPSQLMRMQLAFNQLMDGTISNQILTNIFMIVGDWDAVDESTWKRFQKLDNSLIIRKRNRNATLTPTPPIPFGADRIQMARFIFTMAQLKTGVTDVTLGESPGSLQSGQAIEGLVEGANLMTRSRASRLEDFFARVGSKLLSRTFQFKTADQVISMVGPTGDAVDYAIKRQEFFTDDQGQALSDEERTEVFKHMRFIVAPGSSGPGTKQRRGETAFKGYAAGLIPGKHVLQAWDYPDAENTYKEAREEAKTRSPEEAKGLQAAAGLR